MSNVEDWQVHYRVSNKDLERYPEYAEYVQAELDRLEKEAIYETVKQVKDTDSWITIKPERIQKQGWGLYGERETNYYLRIHCLEAKISKVYVPVYTAYQMPKDVFECTFCGGMTKNDMRGHCSGCGGPRNNKYLER